MQTTLKRAAALALALTLTAGTAAFADETADSVGAQIEKYTGNAALAEWAQSQTDDITGEAWEAVVDNILYQKLGINDKALCGQIVGSLLKDDEWGELMDSAADDPMLFSQNLQVLLGKAVVRNVPESLLSSALDGLVDGDYAELVPKAAEAAGYLAEGRGTDAARIIGEAIADQFLLTHAAKVAAAAVELQIAAWTDEQVEAAYAAYLNGVESSSFFGPQIEAGDFEQVWEQMDGAARQVQIYALDQKRRELAEAGLPPMTEAEEEKVRQQAKTNLQTMFERRREAEAEIAATKAEYDMVMNMFLQSNLLEEGRYGFSGGYGLEQRMDSLMHFREKLLRDTGRERIIDGVFDTDKVITLNQLRVAAQGWFGTKDPLERQRLYEEYLLSEFGIAMEKPRITGFAYAGGADFGWLAQYAMYLAATSAGTIRVDEDGYFTLSVGGVTGSVGKYTTFTIVAYEMTGRIDPVTGEGTADIQYTLDLSYSKYELLDSDGLYKVWEVTTVYDFRHETSGTATLRLQGDDTLILSETLKVFRTGGFVDTYHYVYKNDQEKYSEQPSYEGIFDESFTAAGSYQFTVTR